MKKNTLTPILALFGLLSFSAIAADEYGTLAGHRGALEAPRMYVAPKAGLVVPLELNGQDANFAWGVEAGFPIADHSTLALSIVRAYENAWPITGKWIQHSIAGEGIYYGLQAGVVHGPKTDTNDFGAGIVLGYDHRVTPQISIGLSAEHVTAFADETYHLLHFMVPVKFYF